MLTRTTVFALAAIAVALIASPVSLADPGGRGDRGDRRVGRDRGDRGERDARVGVRIVGDRASVGIRLGRGGKPSIDFRYGSRRVDHRGRRPRYGRDYPSADRGPGYRSPRPRYDDRHSSRFDYERRAWRYLGRNRPHQAMKSFARAAKYEPYSASIKAGYAVATGLYGDTSKGAWAMRRAIELGPDKIMYIPTDRRIERRLDKLASSLNYQLHQYGPDADVAMLLAGVELMRHNEAAAYRAVECAHDLGDHSRAVTVLLKHLHHYADEYAD